MLPAARGRRRPGPAWERAPGLLGTREVARHDLVHETPPEAVGALDQWADQPSTGRIDGESYNIGLVDVTDRPYPDLVEALKQTHRRVRGLHLGEIVPTQNRPAAN